MWRKKFATRKLNCRACRTPVPPPSVKSRIAAAAHHQDGRHRRYRFVLFLIAAGVFALSVLGGGVGAFAHADLLFSTPAANSTVAVAPTQVSLVFDNPVTIQKTPVILTGPQGALSAGTPALLRGGTSLKVPIPGGAGKGIYRVTWQVTADDGDIIAGSYRFAVGPATVGVSSGPTTDTKGFWQTAVLRGLLFAALALGVGELFARRLLRRLSAESALPRSWMGAASILGLVASAGLALLLLGNGSLIAGFSHPAWNQLRSGPGLVTLVEVAGFLAAAVAVLTRRTRWASVPLVAVLAAEAARAHPGAAAPLIGMPLTVLHLGGAALWVGALVYVLRAVVAWRHHPSLSRSAIAVYSRAAAWIFIAVVVTGLSSALILLPVTEIITTGYGRVLLIKVAVVTVTAGLAWLARHRLHRRASLARIRRPAWLEAFFLSGVLALSAVLTVLPPPVSPDAPLPFAPPANGPVVPAAALAGYVEVNAEASAGQLVIQLDAPEMGNETATASSLAVALADPGGTVTQLTFRRCGKGCFVTPVKWKNGSSRLSVSPKVGDWPTVTTGLTVNWPARPVGALLTKAISVMKTVPAFTLHERVTSNSSRGLGRLVAFQMSGSQFIENALYSSGNVPAVVRLPDVDGNRRIAISYPSEDAVDELTLAPDGKILAETLTAPSHLITHTFIYPETG